MTAETEGDVTDRQADTDDAGERGEQWVKHYHSEFSRLPTRTHVAINCRTGEYVTGSTSLTVIDEYERRFGSKEPGYMIEIGGGAAAGWGEALSEIVGHVDARGRPVISLSVPGQDDSFLVTVDTGFNRHLLIDQAEVARLRCDSIDLTMSVELAGRERRRLKGRMNLLVFLAPHC
jgi:hypothetical protein